MVAIEDVQEKRWKLDQYFIVLSHINQAAENRLQLLHGTCQQLRTRFILQYHGKEKNYALCFCSYIISRSFEKQLFSVRFDPGASPLSPKGAFSEIESSS